MSRSTDGRRRAMLAAKRRIAIAGVIALTAVPLAEWLPARHLDARGGADPGPDAQAVETERDTLVGSRSLYNA